ncbi:MAG: rod shape-determining protein [Candidatus Zipacnadales bacterium]
MLGSTRVGRRGRPLWSRLFARLGRNLGIDLGTANTLVHVEGRGILLWEPSVVAIDRETGEVLAVGSDAKRMVGRTPGTISAVRPLKDGVIADFDVTEAMLHHFIQKAHQRRPWEHPRVVIGVPSGITEVERRAVEDAARLAGAWETEIIDEPMAAAIGAGLPVAEAVGSMVVDIGGGTTEVAVISLGGICTQRSMRIAGNEIDEAIQVAVRQEHGLYIGEATSELIKIDNGSAYPTHDDQPITIRGKDLVSGLPRGITLTASAVREYIREPVSAIVELVKETLDATPPELAADIMNHGIVLTGGGALLRGLDQLIAHETSIPVYVAEDPMTCVVMGAAKYIEELGRHHETA